MSAAKREWLETAPFQCLGYDHGVYYYLPHETGQITALTTSQHRAGRLLWLAPLEWWRDTFPKGRNGVDWLVAVDALYRASAKAGVFRPEGEDS